MLESQFALHSRYMCIRGHDFLKVLQPGRVGNAHPANCNDETTGQAVRGEAGAGLITVQYASLLHPTGLSRATDKTFAFFASLR
jgi:hypothetical protein